MIPGLSSVTFDGKSLFRTATADFNTTFAISFRRNSYFAIYLNQRFWFWGYVGKYIPVKQLKKDIKMGV